MATVVVEGVFMGANIKNSTFDGKTKSNLYVDIYQPNSESSDKMIQLKSDDVGIYQKLVDQFSMGSIVKANAMVNAYQNKAYFKLVNFFE